MIFVKSEIPVPAQPLDLRTGVPVHNIALFILEAPGYDDKDIPFANPDLLLNLPLDPAHPGNPVVTPDPYMIRSHHEFGTSEHLAVPFLWQPYPDYLSGFIFLLVKAGQYTISSGISFRCSKPGKILIRREYIIISFGGEIRSCSQDGG